MKAIETHYLGSTDRRSSRIVASDSDGNKVTIPYPGELDTEKAHRKAAYILKNKMGWHGKLVGGSTKKGYVFVFVS